MAGKGLSVLRQVGAGSFANNHVYINHAGYFRGSFTGIGGGSPEVANTAQLTPLDGGYTIDKVYLVSNAPGNAGQKVRLGVYASDGDQLPGALVEEFGEITLAGGFGQVETFTLGTPRALDLDKRYWFALAWNSASTFYRFVAGAFMDVIGCDDYTTKNQVRALRKSITYASGLPDPFPTGTATFDMTSQVVASWSRISAIAA